LAPLITALGASIVLEQAIRNFYPNGTRQPRFPEAGAKPLFPEGQLTFLNRQVRVPYLWIFIVGVAIAMMLGLLLFIGRTRLGKAMRASAQDRDAARLMGIDIDRIIALTFVIGSSMAAVGGVLTGLYARQIEFFMGFGAGLKAFTAAVLGGIGNIRGAMFGGFLLGMVESLAAAKFGGQAWQDVWAFMVLVAVLVFRPTGLFGERVAV
jgi:branched-chain amino acid transport system permease protein